MRKKGKKHNNICVLPNGFRRNTVWELPVRAALLAMNSGQLTEGQLYDLYVLAQMAIRVGAKAHYLTHAQTLDRLVGEVGGRVGYGVTRNEAIAIEASAGVLLEYMAGVSNFDIAKAAMKGAK